MNHPCPNVANQCDCTNELYPISNFSSEAVEELTYTVPRWPIRNVCLGCEIDDAFGPYQPPNVCDDPTSEIYAEICADNPTVPPPLTPETPTGPGENPITVYYNTAQSCSAYCPDGTLFTYTVPAGTFAADSQAMANERAYSYACVAVYIYRVCLTVLTQKACLDTAFADVITVNKPGVWTFSVTSGALPDGLSIVAGPASNQCTIAGTPTTTGDFVFGITAVGPGALSGSKTYQISVLGIVTNAIDDANEGAAYTFSFTSAGGTAPYTYGLELGPLPAGLTLAADGTISGTPTESGDFPITVSVSDSAGNFCTKDFTLTVGTGCPDWDTMTFPENNPPYPLVSTLGTSTGSITPMFGQSNSVNLQGASSCLPGNGVALATDAFILYNGPGCNCNFHLEVVRTGDFANCIGGSTLRIIAPAQILVNPGLQDTGSYDYPFTLPDTGGATIEIYLYIHVQIDGIATFNPTTYSMTATITNV